jgi:peptidylprolyl isomerase
MRGVEKFMIILLLIVAVAIPACSQKETKLVQEDKKVPTVASSAQIKTPSGLAYEDLVGGSGASPAPGKQVVVHYTGWLENGTKFDSSLDKNEPFTFVIGAGQVIPGWDEGVMTMKIGGKRKLVIPPQLGYGAAGAGGVIPPNATLIFEVMLLDVK